MSQFNSIKNNQDIELFLNNTNGLHDGYVIAVQYSNNGIKRVYNLI